MRAPTKKRAVRYLEGHYVYARLPAHEQTIYSVNRIREEEVLYVWDGDY